MQGTAQQFTQALRAGAYRCPFCGAPATLQMVDKAQMATLPTGTIPPDGLSRHPYQFWVWWSCQQTTHDSSGHNGIFAASDLVYWSRAETQEFMREHPRWVSEPELLVEYAGQPALRLQMADTTSATRLTVLADRQNLRVLAIF